MGLNLKKHYSQFLQANPNRLHFAAHSHHPWPDVTWEGHQKAYQDAIRLADQKWGYVFSELIPSIQRDLNRLIGGPEASQIVFAPNLSELNYRILSCFTQRPLKILSSSHEFHSFRRLAQRLVEDSSVTWDQLDPEIEAEAILQKVQREKYDLVFFSHVHFSNGFVNPWSWFEKLVDSLSQETVVVIDGYHSFAALEVNLGKLKDRIFFMAGGYKYAQAGEGACFMTVPKSTNLRPGFTGWFSDFAGLENPTQEKINYGPDAMRFMGSTFDPSGLYRMRAVLNWWQEHNISVAKIRSHVLKLQKFFIEELKRENHFLFRPIDLVRPPGDQNANFLCFKIAEAKNIAQELISNEIICDARGDILRLGFGPYHDFGDVDQLIRRSNKLRATV